MIKSNDIALIILVSSIALVASWFIAGSLINTDENRSQEVEVIRNINSDFTPPAVSIFNDQATNPTESINIRENDKELPFIDSTER